MTRATVVLLGLTACGPTERELSRERVAASWRSVNATIAEADEAESRLVAARTLPGECRDALREARSRQHGALMLVRGDHCAVVRELPPRRTARVTRPDR